MINSVEGISKNYHSGQIIHNQMWVPKVYQPSLQNIEVQSELA
jgi:hypothetical protein